MPWCCHASEANDGMVVTSWASYQIRRIEGCACARNAGNVSAAPLVSDPDMHHGTCVTHVPWCMSGSLTSGFLWSRWRENVPGIPSACATCNFTYLVRGPWQTELMIYQHMVSLGYNELISHMTAWPEKHTLKYIEQNLMLSEGHNELIIYEHVVLVGHTEFIIHQHIH